MQNLLSLQMIINLIYTHGKPLPISLKLLLLNIIRSVTGLDDFFKQDINVPGRGYVKWGFT